MGRGPVSVELPPSHPPVWFVTKAVAPWQLQGPNVFKRHDFSKVLVGSGVLCALGVALKLEDHVLVTQIQLLSSPNAHSMKNPRANCHPSVGFVNANLCTLGS